MKISTFFSAMSSMCIWLVPWTYSQQWRLAVLAQLRWSIQGKDRVPTCPTWSLTRLTTCESCLTTLLAAAPQNGLVSLQKRSVSMRNGSLISNARFWCMGLHSAKWLFHLCERWCPQKPALLCPWSLCLWCPFIEILLWGLTTHFFKNISLLIIWYHILYLGSLEIFYFTENEQRSCRT